MFVRNMFFLPAFVIFILLFAPFPPPAGAEPPSPPEKATISVGFSQFDAQKGLPAGWILDRKFGKAVLRSENSEDGPCLTMVSDDRSSFGIKKAIKVDVREYPYLSWRWKANRLPLGADVRRPDKDDQAAQIYIAFPSTGFPAALNTPVLTYIWDTEVPKEWMGRSPQLGRGKIRYIVLRNKTDKLGEWYTEKRNIYRDYQRLFKDVRGGEPAGPIQGICLFINSQHTRSSAESSICNIRFSRQ